MNKNNFMQKALEEAQEAYKQGEIPVGAVIVRDSEIIASAHNENRQIRNPTRHAEIIAIEIASNIINNERLIDCDLYVTKEPCAMCAGAIVHARLRKVIIGTKDSRYGACGTVVSICGNKLLNHVPEIEFGVLENESSRLLKKFFYDRRNKK